MAGGLGWGAVLHCAPFLAMASCVGLSLAGLMGGVQTDGRPGDG